MIYSMIGKSNWLGPVPTIEESLDPLDQIKVFESEAEIWVHRTETKENKRLLGLPRWLTIAM